MDSYAGLFLESVQNKVGVSQVADIIVPRLVVKPLSLLVSLERLVDPLAWIDCRVYADYDKEENNYVRPFPYYI